VTSLIWEDHVQIRDVLHAYCRLLDVRRPDAAAKQVFAEAAIADYGRVPVPTGREEIEAMFTRSLAALSGTAHMVSNIEIFVDDDVVTSSTYVTAWHWMLDESAPVVRPADFGLVAVYEDTWTRTTDGWRIAHRKLRPLGGGGVAVGALPERFRGFAGVNA
jgi:SnoaL-like domain